MDFLICSCRNRNCRFRLDKSMVSRSTMCTWPNPVSTMFLSSSHPMPPAPTISTRAYNIRIYILVWVVICLCARSLKASIEWLGVPSDAQQRVLSRSRSVIATHSQAQSHLFYQDIQRHPKRLVIIAIACHNRLPLGRCCGVGRLWVACFLIARRMLRAWVHC